MSEKKYLLSAGDIREYLKLDFACHESQEMDEMEELLAAHEYSERTCHAVGKNGKPYQPRDYAYLLGAICDECGGFLGGQDESHAGEYCRRCGAKVVEQW